MFVLLSLGNKLFKNELLEQLRSLATIAIKELFVALPVEKWLMGTREALRKQQSL